VPPRKGNKSGGVKPFVEGEPFEKSRLSSFSEGYPGIYWSRDAYIKAGFDTKHYRELSFPGEKSLERAVLAAQFYEFLKKKGLFHPDTIFGVYRKEGSCAVFAAMPKLEEEADEARAREITELVRELQKKHGLPGLNADYSIGLQAHLAANFGSDGAKTYLADLGIFTVREWGYAPHPEKILAMLENEGYWNKTLDKLKGTFAWKSR